MDMSLFAITLLACRAWHIDASPHEFCLSLIMLFLRRNEKEMKITSLETKETPNKQKTTQLCQLRSHHVPSAASQKNNEIIL